MGICKELLGNNNQAYEHQKWLRTQQIAYVCVNKGIYRYLMIFYVLKSSHVIKIIDSWEHCTLRQKYIIYYIICSN